LPPFFLLPCSHAHSIDVQVENVSKLPGDKPKEKVVIAKSGELAIEAQYDSEGKEIPLHAEL